MKAFRVHARCSVCEWIFFLLALAVAPLSRADEPPVPPLDEQLTRAQAKPDHESVAELCRRRLDAPGADAPSLLKALFAAQLELKDFPRAAQTLERLEKTTPSAKATVAELRGDLALAKGKKDDSKTDPKALDEALASWNTALTSDPVDLVGLRGKIADALDDAGRWEEAAGAFRAALRMSPGHAARQARLAVCLLNAGHAADADKEMQIAVRADATDATVKVAAPMFDRLRPQLPTLRKLEARIAAGDPPGSKSPLDVSAGADNVLSASLDRALILYQAGNYAGALQDAERASPETPDPSLVGGLLQAMHDQFLAARLLRGQCLWQLDRDKEAVALGIAKIPDKKWFGDEARFYRLRAADNAARLATTGAAVRAFTVRASILLEADQPVLALQEARYAETLNHPLDPPLDDTEIVLAATLLRNDRVEEALAVARHATEDAPNNPDSWAMLGRLEQENRADFDAAVKHLTRALKMREEPRWLRRRETCLRTLGRNDEADRDAKRLTQLPPMS